MDGVVAFDPTWFGQIYPEFAAVSAPQVAMYFTMATQLCDNTPSSVITDWTPQGIRAVCLNALTAHVMALAGLGVGNAARSGLVGRIASAGQGSVNVSVDMPSSPSSAWFMQTQYGATYWQLTAPYRTMRYFPACPRNMDPFRPW